MLTDVLTVLERTGQLRGSQLCELGKIKIGGKGEKRKAKDGSDWYLPTKFDHFVITTMSRDGDSRFVNDDELMTSLAKDYADKDGKLRRLPVRFLSDDIDDIIQTSFVWYSGKKVAARSDGRTVVWFKDYTKGNVWHKEPVEEPWDDKFLKLQVNGNACFKVHTILNCVIAAKEARWGGVYKFRTTSLISLRQLQSSILHLMQLTGGIIVGMPLQLVLRPMQVSPNGQISTIYVVHVELRGPDLLELQKMALERAQYKITFRNELREVQNQYKALLLAPGHEEGGSAGDVQEEFQPEAGQGEVADKRINTIGGPSHINTVGDLSKAIGGTKETITPDGEVLNAEPSREPGDEPLPENPELDKHAKQLFETAGDAQRL